MSLLANVSHGVSDRSKFIIFYGVPGIGKTTLASKFPKSLIIDIEDGAGEIDGAKLEQSKIKDFDGLMAVVTELRDSNHEFKSVVIDSVTALEKMIEQSVCQAYKVKNLNEIAFGGGNVAVINKLNEFVAVLKAIQNKKIDIIVIGHQQVKSYTDPSLNQAYDRIMIQSNTKFAQNLMSVADCVFFIKYLVEVATDARTKKTQAFSEGDRAIFTEFRAAFDAKNRYGLPFQIPFDYEALRKAFEDSKPRPASTLKSEISDLLSKVDEATSTRVRNAVTAAGDDAQKLKNIKAKLLTICEATSNANA